MLILALKPGHDGAIAAIRDGRLLFSIEAEKDSYRRYTDLTAATVLAAAELCDQIPDVVALGGWYRRGAIDQRIGAGYEGFEIHRELRTLFGKKVRYFSSSHERSHLMMALGMAPETDAELRTVLVWEGYTGAFYLVDRQMRVVEKIPVLSQPGVRYASLFSIADPGYPDEATNQRFEDSGKLMALAAFARPQDADQQAAEVVDRLLRPDAVLPLPKSDFRSSPLHNAGVTSPVAKSAAALLSHRIFETFREAAGLRLPAGTPLHISGGCGLNCDWNGLWRQCAHFSSVFVPPCTNDSGSAIGTAIDAMFHETGRQTLDWDVYSGLPFEMDTAPDPAGWSAQRFDPHRLGEALSAGRVVAWVQGKWEIGPRALGHRSLLAEPFDPRTKDRLNAIKAREDYRPIAPVCRAEDVAALFDTDFPDPHMLYFRRVRDAGLGAVTHVDGTARVQTVTRDEEPVLHSLLTSFAEQRGAGILCNTSLNFNGRGFINRMSDLVDYCEARGVDDMVVDDVWYSKTDSR
ncbi:carbamoyltransferase C-terminal domain-containing protein [Kitasatospora sp. MAP5-34]|uniref:carbamoyltransferase C-terminal domain-containing protein n=1 Tax=Kitasatospora sp. MAP5-34 TaxID=3035102 RepID=UPI002474CA97|nr:carbamoyltransferase C-terminal domain-containing protein [Kitasatospora sp. MAP5-34]MDH6575306.1 hydroxymethyl cephem carbamoyltransferase [Kitasatospora sp. MAP5-34]